jgi:hypothetical protein
VHISEKSDHAARRRPSPDIYGQSLTTRQVASLHLFSVAAKIVTTLPSQPEGQHFSRKNCQLITVSNVTQRQRAMA